MKYWFDCEFLDRGGLISLISIGLVAEDGREYYTETPFAAELCSKNEWLIKNVAPLLMGRTKRTAEIATEIMEFVGEKPAFWSYCGAYDWVCLCQLYGRMIDIPNSWPHYCHELSQLHESLGSPPIPPALQPQHHALVDARWHKAIYNHLMNLRQSGLLDTKEVRVAMKEGRKEL